VSTRGSSWRGWRAFATSSSDHVAAETRDAGHQASYFGSFLDRVAGQPESISDNDFEIYAAAYIDPARLSAGFEVYRAFPVDTAAN
jgi:hypothetical protein